MNIMITGIKDVDNIILDYMYSLECYEKQINFKNVHKELINEIYFNVTMKLTKYIENTVPTPTYDEILTLLNTYDKTLEWSNNGGNEYIISKRKQLIVRKQKHLIKLIIKTIILIFINVLLIFINF